MKIFLDTNILLDLVLRREDEASAKAIVETAFRGETIRLYASYLSVANLAYVIRRQPPEKVRDCVRDIVRWCNILPCNDMQIIQAGSLSCEDFEDALQIMCAEEKHCDAIITRNPAHFRCHTEIPVLSPDEFLSHLGR